MIDTRTSPKVRTAILPGEVTTGEEPPDSEGRHQYFPPGIPKMGGKKHLVEHDFPSFYYRKPQTSRSKSREKSLEQ